MGSWSVSCGISNIAITSGEKCVLIPLKENKGIYGYHQYIPASIPIFGEYDDYGGIENIEKNLNTELIEKETGVTIEEFCTFLVDGTYTYNREEYQEVNKKINNPEHMNKLRFMWMDRQVYDFMTTKISSNAFGSFVGKEFILRKLGFVKLDKVSGDKRYKNVWEKDGKELYGDGSYIHTVDGQSIFDITGHYSKESTLAYHFKLNDEDLIDKDIYSFYESMNVEEARNYLSSLICGRDYVNFDMDLHIDLEGLLELHKDDEEKLGRIRTLLAIKKSKFLVGDYTKNVLEFKKELSEIGRLYRNLHCISGTFRPHELYLTPQCGEYEEHQIFLDKFAEINKSYIQED